MNITIIETNKKEILSIVDPKSGMDWTNDLLGNHGDLPDYNDETDSYHMTQESFEWWSDLIERYQVADNRYNDLLHNLSEDNANDLMLLVQEISCDLGDHPEYLQRACDDAEGK